MRYAILRSSGTVYTVPYPECVQFPDRMLVWLSHARFIYVHMYRRTPKAFSSLFGMYGGLAPIPMRQEEKTFGVRLVDSERVMHKGKLYSHILHIAANQTAQTCRLSSHMQNDHA